MFSQKIWTSTFQSSESFRSFFKTKVLLGIYQEDFFLILETFLSGEERVFLLQVETFAEQASSLALFSKICSTLKHRKCQNPPKILLRNERNSFERRGWWTATAFLLLFNDKPLLFTCLQHFHIYNMGSWFWQKLSFSIHFQNCCSSHLTGKKMFSKKRMHVQKCHFRCFGLFWVGYQIFNGLVIPNCSDSPTTWCFITVSAKYMLFVVLPFYHFFKGNENFSRKILGDVS